MSVREPMRVLSVRQPYAWAIIHAQKDVENRPRNIAGSYRGPVAIHVSKTYADDVSTRAQKAMDRHALAMAGPTRAGTITDAELFPWRYHGGAIIGVVDIVGVHDSRRDGCGTRQGQARLGELIPTCSEWAEVYAWHLVLANPRPLREPFGLQGSLGLRRLPPDQEKDVMERLVG